MNSLISIIIPTYNPQKYLLFALRSILEQSYKNIEIIIVDDGSKVDVEEMLKDSMYLDKVQLIKQKNMGAPVARNRGFVESCGEFVIFWDDDVIGKSEMLEKMYQALIENNDASFAYSNFYFGLKKMPAQKFDKEKLKENNYIITTSLIKRKDFSGFDEKLKRFQDWDLWLTMADNGKKGIFINEYLFKAVPKRMGISNWLPKFAYKMPYKNMWFWKKKVEEYEKAREVVKRKHNIK
jgi:glycosyltransferase involved in cell wall biosynthesis